MNTSLSLRCFHQSLPLAQIFRISRGAKTTAEVIVVVLSDGQHTGWGEAVPYARYGESIDSVSNQLWALSDKLNAVEQHGSLQDLLPAGSARNALDCAFWDLKSKQLGKSVNALLGIPAIEHCNTAQTLSVDRLEVMRASAQKLKQAPIVKVKLDGDAVLEKMQAIHQVCPASRFIVDANEGWSFELLQQVAEPLSQLNVTLIEQPLPANQDDALRGFHSAVPLCADESCHTSHTLEELLGKYQYINIKLDKTGGLSEAIQLLKQAQQANMGIMVGCMVASSLAMAPAFSLCSQAEFVDLDGPLLVAKDREQGFAFQQGEMSTCSDLLWGTGRAALPTDLAKLIDPQGLNK